MFPNTKSEINLTLRPEDDDSRQDHHPEPYLMRWGISLAFGPIFSSPAPDLLTLVTLSTSDFPSQNTWRSHCLLVTKPTVWWFSDLPWLSGPLSGGSQTYHLFLNRVRRYATRHQAPSRWTTRQKDSLGLLNWESHVEKVAADEKNIIKVYSDINKYFRKWICGFYLN